MTARLCITAARCALIVSACYTRFRKAAATANRRLRRTRWRYSMKLKRLAIDHYLERSGEGRSHSKIAKELGLSPVTLEGPI